MTKGKKIDFFSELCSAKNAIYCYYVDECGTRDWLGGFRAAAVDVMIIRVLFFSSSSCCRQLYYFFPFCHVRCSTSGVCQGWGGGEQRAGFEPSTRQLLSLAGCVWGTVISNYELLSNLSHMQRTRSYGLQMSQLRGKNNISNCALFFLCCLQ